MRPIIGITQDVEKRQAGGYSTCLDKSYQDAVYRFGGMPLVLPVLPDAGASGLARRIDGLLFSGGEDIHPRYFGGEVSGPLLLSPDMRTEFELALLKEALAIGKPVLAICLGIQTMNVALGGKLRQDIPGHKQKGGALYHEVELAGCCRLRGIVGADSITVNSTHHQAVGELGEDLIAAAAAPDGTVEAIEVMGQAFALGLQWHPEKMPDDPATQKIFTAFINACGKTGKP